VKGASTCLGAASIVRCLERYKPHVVITSRVADAALFLAPMVWESSIRRLSIYVLLQPVTSRNAHCRPLFHIKVHDFI